MYGEPLGSPVDKLQVCCKIDVGKSLVNYE